MDILSSEVQDVADGTLKTNDGVAGTGEDEVVVTWSFTYTGDFDPEIIHLSVDMLEYGGVASSFVSTPLELQLPLDSSHDAVGSLV